MPDSQPNYLTTAPDGTVGAKFTGEIAAKGMRLDAVEAGVTTPENPNKPPGPNFIVWRDILELTYGKIDTFKVGNDGQLDIQVIRNDGTAAAKISMATIGDLLSSSPIVVSAKDIGRAEAQRTLLNGRGESDFSQNADFIVLPRVTVNTTSVSNQQIAGWNFTPRHAGRMLAVVWHQAYTSIAPAACWGTAYCNGVVLDSTTFFFNQNSVWATLPPAIAYTPSLPAGVNATVTILNSGNIHTDNSFGWAGGLLLPAA